MYNKSKVILVAAVTQLYDDDGNRVTLLSWDIISETFMKPVE